MAKKKDSKKSYLTILLLLIGGYAVAKILSKKKSSVRADNPEIIPYSKNGSTVGGALRAFATAFSLALQYGMPLHKGIQHFKGCSFEPSGLVLGNVAQGFRSWQSRQPTACFAVAAAG